MWTARDKSLSYDQLKAEAGKAQKDQHPVMKYICKHIASLLMHEEHISQYFSYS